MTVLTLEDQLGRLVGTGPHPTFAVTFGIGVAGEKVAQEVNRRTGWFPSVRRVDVAREEDGKGGYALVTAAGPLESQFAGLDGYESIAVVDDTVFSGLTMRAVLNAMPASSLPNTQAFCLRGVSESLGTIAELCPVFVGFKAEGRPLDEVSFINASGLVRRVGIRRSGQPTLAFFEREQWMQAWFRESAGQVTDLCRRINAIIEPHGQHVESKKP